VVARRDPEGAARGAVVNVGEKDKKDGRPKRGKKAVWKRVFFDDAEHRVLVWGSATWRLGGTHGPGEMVCRWGGQARAKEKGERELHLLFRYSTVGSPDRILKRTGRGV